MSDTATPQVIDARYMEPPDPFVKTMEVLDTLKPGEHMLLLLFREPHPLYRVLAENGHRYEANLVADGTFEITIWR